MRKLLLLMILLSLAGAGTALALRSGASTPLGVLMNADTRTIARLGEQFMEALQYKDFKGAAAFSSPEDRLTADIPKLIERLFQLKPEVLDINHITLLDADIDSTGRRGRTKLGTDLKVLNSQELRHPEVMLYWKKATDGHWYMDLASSLQ